MWGTILSEPLAIVALVGRYPNQLANGTHAHLPPPKLSSLPDAGVGSYAVLIHLSVGYPPVGGRLHTRYAPVRH